MAVQAKISDRSKKMIQEITHKTGESQIAVIEQAVLYYHRQWRIDQVNKAYAKLKKNKRAWKEELKEQAIWEKTLKDGLEDA